MTDRVANIDQGGGSFTFYLPTGICHCHLENFVPNCRALPKLVTNMTPSVIGEGILTIKQVAEYLKVTERTIYRLAAAKKIPAFKVGGTWRFSLADIDSWIKQQSMEGLEPDREHDDVGVGQPNNGEPK